MNAMLEARIVAARIQRPLDFERGALAARERITFSSHGSRRIPHMVAKLVFAKCLVGIAIHPALTRLRGSDDRMSRGMRVFGGMLIRRAIATKCNAALLTRAQMNPMCADLHAIRAFAAFRLFDRRNCIEMSASSASHRYLLGHCA